MRKSHFDGRKGNGHKTGEPHQLYPNSDSLVPMANWRQARLKLRRDKVCGGGGHLPPSKITNGHDAIADKSTIPQREAWVARLKDIHRTLLSDLGGEGNCSAAEYSLSRRCATLSVELDYLEGRFAHQGHAEPWQLELYGRTLNSLRKTHLVLGLQRRPKDMNPLPLDYAKRYSRKQQDHDQDRDDE